MIVELNIFNFFYSCSEVNEGYIDIAFNVIDIPTSSCRLYSRRALCTGHLDDITTPIQTISSDIEGGNKQNDDTSEREERLNINEGVSNLFKKNVWKRYYLHFGVTCIQVEVCVRDI